MIQTYNYHTHTYRCGHAKGTDEEYILAACRAGFKVLGFSEHIQFKAQNGLFNRINFEQFPKYFRDIRKLKMKYGDRITIYGGLEAEYIPQYLSDLYYLRDICDYYILGQHKGGIRCRQYESRCTDEDVFLYADDIEQALKTGLFCMIAHPDYIMRVRSSWSAACQDACTKICELSKEYNCPIELNLKGVRGRKTVINDQCVFPYPYRPFWEIAAKLRAPVVFGVDAHAPSELFCEEEMALVQDIISGLDLNILSDYIPVSPDRTNCK